MRVIKIIETGTEISESCKKTIKDYIKEMEKAHGRPDRSYYSTYSEDLVIYEVDGEVVGFIAFTNWNNTEELWLHSVYVKKKYRKQGIYRAMLNKLEQHYRVFKLWLGAILPEAIKAHKAVGFKIDSICKRNNGETVTVLTKDINTALKGGDCINSTKATIHL